MQEIVLGVTLFSSIVLALAMLILLARSRLVPSGDVTITVNSEREIAVPAGGKLLNALTAKELGGSLAVHSDGPGQGAVFTLALPATVKADVLCTT